MKIILSSTNPSKIKSVEKALKDLAISNFNITSVKVNSGVSSKPLNEEMLIGAKNRNIELKKYCYNQHLDYDYLISIEGGFEQEYDKYYVISYVVIEGKNQVEHVGKTIGLEISKEMYNYTKEGHSLNALIEELTSVERNKTLSGVAGFLSSDLLLRQDIDYMAVLSTMNLFINEGKYQLLNDKIKSITKDI
ncbi:MAG: inosine/xanthosine triphosphatase [Bacilli bacterium]